MGRKQPQVDDLTALRDATREAHEAIKTLRIERKACEEERVRLARERDGLADMIKAIWDAQMDYAVSVALESYLPAINEMIDKTEEAIFNRFDTITEVLLGSKKPEALADNNTLIEQLIHEKVTKHGPVIPK